MGDVPEQYHHTPGSSHTHLASTHVGWREWVALPTAPVPWIKAKVDTGAKTSSLHAFDLRTVDRDGHDWVRFTIHPWQATPEDEVTLELPVHDRRSIRSSSGHEEDRIVVQMPISLVGREVLAEITLTDRDEMGFRMLIGRQALAQGFLVDPAASYLGGRPPREVRRRNWGRG